MSPNSVSGDMDIEQLKRLMAERKESQAEIGRMIGLTPLTR